MWPSTLANTNPDNFESVRFEQTEIAVGYSRGDATHFLSYVDTEIGGGGLLDCIPLERMADGTTRVVVFSDDDDSWTVEVVGSERVLSVEEVVRDVLDRVVNDLVLLASEDDQSAH